METRVNRPEIRIDEHRSIDIPRVTTMNLQIKLRVHRLPVKARFDIHIHGEISWKNWYQYCLL